MPEDFVNFWNYTILSMPGWQPLSIGRVVMIFSVLILGYFGSRIIGYLVGRKLSNTNLRPDVVQVVQRIAFFALLILVVMTALSLLGIPLAAFAFATGAIAIGIGFGAQNIINNFISGWILMAERPIRINDFIEMDNAHGTVERIGTRSTRIRRVDGVHLLVPNSLLLERTVVNWTLLDRDIRTTVRVGVVYGSPIDRVAELLMQAVCEQPDVKKDPKPDIVFEDFGDNALIFDAYFWCEVAGEKLLRVIRSDIRFRVARLFEEAEIVVAFPQRDVHLDAKAPLQVHLMPSGAVETAGRK